MFAFFAVMYNDASKVIENGLFQGYDIVVILLVSIQVEYANEMINEHASLIVT